MRPNIFRLTNFGSPARRRRRGSILILGTVTMTALFGMLGLTFDAAYMYHLKREAQIAADAGAKAASFELQNGSTNHTIKTQAKAETALNGFTDGTNGVTITVNKPPVGGNYAGNVNAVQVIVKQAVTTSFMQVLGVANAQVVAEAVGGLQSGMNCIYALSTTANNAFVESGGTSTVQANCGVVINSDSSNSAFVVSGGATFSASSVSVVGGVSDTSGTDQCGANCTITNSPNAPVTGITAEADPLENIAEPTVGGCTYTNLGTLTGGSAPPSVTPAITGNGTSGNPFVFSAGTYCNGFQLSSAYATFNSGTYIIRGLSGSNQGLAITGSSNVSGSSVTFFLTADTGSHYTQTQISGGSTVNLTAPTSGTLSGMLFFQDRTLTGVNSNDQESFTGGSNMYLTGALYFPLDNLVFSGGSSAHPDYTILVANTITFNGGSSLRNDYSSLDQGSPIQVTGIIE